MKDCNYILVENTCPETNCCKRQKCCCGLEKVSIPAALGDDTPSSEVRPAVGAYCNKIVEYEANGAVYIYSSDGLYTRIKDGNNAYQA